MGKYFQKLVQKSRKFSIILTKDLNNILNNLFSNIHPTVIKGGRKIIHFKIQYMVLFILLLVLVTSCNKNIILQERNLTVEDFQIDTSVNDVVVMTDKDTYEDDEYVYFAIYNGVNETVSLIGERGCGIGTFYYVYQFKDGNWSLLHFNYGGCDVGPPRRDILPNETIITKWDKRYLIKNGRAFENAGKGQYKIGLHYNRPVDKNYNFTTESYFYTNKDSTSYIILPLSNEFILQ